MKKIIATSDGFAGEVVMVYSALDGFPADHMIIRTVDFGACDMKPDARDWFLKYVPRVFAGEYPGFGGGRMQFAEEGLELDFEEDFWKRQLKKVNKDRCHTWWNKATTTKAMRAAAVAGLTPYFAYLQRSGYRKPVDPENYLKKELWKTEWAKVRD